MIQQAELIANHLRHVTRTLRRTLGADSAESGLTVPQVDALEILTAEDSLTVTELSRRMGLAHSTVSGIVDRLEQRGLLKRRPDPADRRYVQILIIEPVRHYLQTRVPQRSYARLARALGQATPAERAQVHEGLAVLKRLLEATEVEP